MDLWTALGIGVALAIAPFARMLVLYPGRLLSRWLWKVLPEGWMRRALLKQVSDGTLYEVSEGLPPPVTESRPPPLRRAEQD